MAPQTEACIIAHALIDAIRRAAYVAAPAPDSTGEGRPVSATGHVPGIGYVKIECRKEWVVRARGEKVRRRYRFFIDGSPRAESVVYERARAL